MLSVKEAQEKIIAADVKRKTAEIPILESCGRILAEDVFSGDFIPAYDNSAVDGFAVRSVDILGADKNYPVKLRLLREDIPAGTISGVTLDSGVTVQIMTGALVPQGCDCVVMREDALKEGRDVLIFRECRQGENVRFKGEDIKKGDRVLHEGKKIYPADIGVMASIGVSRALVYRPPLVGILPTGNELIDISEQLKAAKVRDSNSYSLSALLAELNIPYRMYGIVQDDRELIKKMIASSLAECDILLLTGGVSVGDYDYVKEILDEIGAEFIFWRVNQRPGKPMAFLTCKNRFIFGLPGNPVSVMVCFDLYVRPLIKKIMCDPELFRKKTFARAIEEYAHIEGRTDFVRVKLEQGQGQIYFRLTGMQGSGILTSMVEADGLAVFPEDRGTIEKDSEVEVYILKETG
ncbi:MAG: molybdopterin molybdotransferase MoeA [Actinobacteria bacterium]|nr:molybdopterin molybdotransferase MoeA [Actinomycetota bacterium]